MSDTNFEILVEEALAQDFSGWDFSWLHGRWYEEEPPWSYETMVGEEIATVDSLLDMGTGGGEFLASQVPLPAHTVATESYPPNILVARSRLEPLGVQVVPFSDDEALPLSHGQFELIINRHESYSLPELYRLLKPGGHFVTQQVGSQNCIQLNQFLNAPLNDDVTVWSLGEQTKEFEDAGFRIKRTEEALLDSHFYDIGAVTFFLKIIEWQIPDFTPEKYHNRLLAMHHNIEEHGAFKAKAHRYLIQARKPR